MIPSFPQGAANKSEIDAEKRAAFRRAQSEYLILDQDRQKKTRFSSGLEVEIRRLEMEKDRLELRLEEKREEWERTTRELALLEADAKRLKRKMNMLA